MMGLSISQSLDSSRKASFILGSELWEDKLGSLLGIVKESYIRKVRLYSDNPSVQRTQSQIASGELQGVAGGRGELKCRLLTVPPIALGAWSMLWKPPEYYY